MKSFFIFLFLISSAAAFGQVDVVSNPATIEVAEGADFTITLQVVPNGNAVTVADISMSFDPAKVQVTALALAPGTALPIPSQPPTWNNTTGTFSCGGFNFTAATSTFNHVVVSFTTVGNGTTSVDHILTGFPRTTLAFAGNDVTGSTQNIEVTILGDAPDCPELDVNIGESCDDGNPFTSNDVINPNCQCQGTNPADAQLQGSALACGSKSAVFKFYAPNTANLLLTRNTVFENGSFVLNNLPLGNYDLVLAVNGALPIGFADINLGSGTNNLPPFNLTVGNINNDLSINITDVSFLNASFGLSQNLPGFNANADLNCNGQVNIVDVSILNAGFGNTGASAPL